MNSSKNHSQVGSTVKKKRISPCRSKNQVLKHGKGICATPHCKNKHDVNGWYCGTCRIRKERERDPIKYAWRNLISNARRRGVLCDLSLDDFKEFCVKTGYIGKKGRTSQSYSIDRIDISKGYTKGNIQIMSVSDNVKKRFVYDYRDKYAKYVIQEQEKYEDAPF